MASNTAEQRHGVTAVRPSPDDATAIRADRDRFVAFAFSAADILLELDSSHVIRYAAGAVTALLGVSPADLDGRPLLSLAPAQARPVLGELLLAIHDGRRLPIRCSQWNFRTRRNSVLASMLSDPEWW